MKKLMILLVAAAMFGGCNSAARKVADRLVEVGGAKSEVIADANEVAKLRSEAVETLTVGANSYRLEAYLWRDFMPDAAVGAVLGTTSAAAGDASDKVSGAAAGDASDKVSGAAAGSASVGSAAGAVSGGSLTSINWLVEANSAAIPSGSALLRQFVIHGDQIWVADYTDETRPSTEAHKLEQVSRGGPKWGPDVDVDVVAEVSVESSDGNSASGKRHFLISKNVPIIATY